MALLEIEGCTKCHICGYKHSFFPEYLDSYFLVLQRRRRRILMMTEMLSYRTLIPFEDEKCENNEFDKEFDYGVQWATKMEKLLEEDEWKKEAFKNSSASSKLTQSIRGFEYLQEVNTIVVQQKKRLMAPKYWCSHSLKLRIQLTKVEKLLNKKFEEVSKMLNDIEVDVDVAENDSKFAKDGNSSSMEIHPQGTSSPEERNFVNFAKHVINEFGHTSISADIEEQCEDQSNDRKRDCGETRDFEELSEDKKRVDDKVVHESEKHISSYMVNVFGKLLTNPSEEILKLHRADMNRSHCLYSGPSRRFELDQFDLVDLLEFGSHVVRRHSALARRSIERVKQEIKLFLQLLNGISLYWEQLKTQKQKVKGSCRTRTTHPLMMSLSSCSVKSSVPQKRKVAQLFIFWSLLSMSQAGSLDQHQRDNDHPTKLLKRDFDCGSIVVSDVEDRAGEQEELTWSKNNNSHCIVIIHEGLLLYFDDLLCENLFSGVWSEILLEGTTVEQLFKVTTSSRNSTGLLKDCDYMTVTETLKFELVFVVLTILEIVVYLITKYGVRELVVISRSIAFVSLSTIIYLEFSVEENTDEVEEQKKVCDSTTSCYTLCSLIGSLVTIQQTDFLKSVHATIHHEKFCDNDFDIRIQGIELNVNKDFESKYLRNNYRSNVSILNEERLCKGWTCQVKDRVQVAIVPSETEEIATSEDKQLAEDIESSSDTVEPFESDTEEPFESDTMKKENLSRDELLWIMIWFIIMSSFFNVFPNSKNMNQPWAPNKEIKDLPELYIDVPELVIENEAVIAEETRLPSCISCELASHEQLYAADVFCVREKDRLRAPENASHAVQLIDGSEEEITFDETKPTDNEPFEAAGDNVDIHDRGMAKVYIPSKDEDIIFEYSAQACRQTDVKEFDLELKQEKDENNFDDVRQRTLDLPKEWVARNRHSQASRRNFSKDTHFMTEIEKKNNGDVDVSVLIPSTPDIPHRCEASFPIDDVPTAFEANAATVQKKRKLRLQVVPNSPQQHRKHLKSKTPLRKPESKSEMMFHSDETFRNLKYKLKADQSKKKTLDYTLNESEFDLFAFRNLTWLSLNELPVPRIDLTVAFAPQFDPIMVIIDQIANGTPPTPHISMRYELLRFCTLRSYPKENKPFIIKLAEAGFYYASDGDGVVCYCCGIRRYNWVEEDIPMKIHKRVNPNCKFLKKNEEVNVPVQYYGPYGKALMAIMDIPEPVEREDRSEDVNNDWAPERVSSPAASQPNRRSESAANSLGINTATPKHTQYATKTARVGSYSGWPDTASHTPEVLADAGFFYAGFGDCVRCFYCGIGLRHWTKEDDPFVEHARWSRNCVFVKQKKGEEFVNLVQMAAQYSQENENETQSSSPAGNQLPAQEVERLLLSDAAQSVLEMGYQPRIIKRAIEQILRQNGNEKITAQTLMERVLEIEEADERAQAASAQSVEGASAQATAKPLTAKPSAAKGEGSKSDKDKANDKDKKSSNDNKDKKEDKTSSPSNGLSSEAASQDPKEIKKENEELKEQTLCKVCLDNTVCIVFLPCGHLVTCADCAPAMRKCPICRAVVKGTVRTYMS